MSETQIYTEKILSLRAERERNLLRNPLNWFSLSGLFLLQDGDNSFSGDASSDICIEGLPENTSGIFHLQDGKITLTSCNKSVFTVNASEPTKLALRTDVDGDLDLIEAGVIAMRLIKRGDNVYLRVWNREAETLKHFNGLKYFPVNRAYMLIAEYIPFHVSRSFTIRDAIGGEHNSIFNGEAHFTLNGGECSLIAEEVDDGLLFSFTDPTRADATYPGGRYLVCPPPAENKLILDFNLAVNWPCAYTSYATCPLPPAQNRLKVRVEAGEMRYHN